MKKYIRSYILISTILFLLIKCSSVTEKTITFNDIDKLMNSAIADSIFPGAELVFGINDKVLYSKAFGHYTYNKSSKNVTTSSIFDLASVTKVVGTTSAAMLLVDNGKMKLDDKVIKYLPEFNNNGKENITIRNLLLHNSGLTAFKKYYDSCSTKQEVISDIMNLPLNSIPGEKYVYSDLGMITLQRIIEKIEMKSLDIFLEENLFSKLNMKSTMYKPSELIKNKCVPTEDDNFFRMRLLQGEVHDERAFLLDGVAGHAGLFSTAEDLSKFAIMLLQNGQIADTQVINSNIIKNWTTKQSEQSDRGLGWDTKSMEGYSSAGDYFSSKSFGHTGYTGTSIWLDKDNRLFVVLLTNRVHPSRKNKKISSFRPLLHNTIYKSLF